MQFLSIQYMFMYNNFWYRIHVYHKLSFLASVPWYVFLQLVRQDVRLYNNQPNKFWKILNLQYVQELATLASNNVGIRIFVKVTHMYSATMFVPDVNTIHCFLLGVLTFQDARLVYSLTKFSMFSSLSVMLSISSCSASVGVARTKGSKFSM